MAKHCDWLLIFFVLRERVLPLSKYQGLNAMNLAEVIRDLAEKNSPALGVLPTKKMHRWLAGNALFYRAMLAEIRRAAAEEPPVVVEYAGRNRIGMKSCLFRLTVHGKKRAEELAGLLPESYTGDIQDAFLRNYDEHRFA